MTQNRDELKEKLARAISREDGYQAGESSDFETWHWEESLPHAEACLSAIEQSGYSLTRPDTPTAPTHLSGAEKDGRHARGSKTMGEEQERHKSVMTLERIEANANLTLWCVHILGPDDVIAAATHEAAVERAHELNLSIHERDHKPNDLLCFAYAAPWPHDKQSHADELKAQDDG